VPVNMNKMRGQKAKTSSQVDWDDICGYDGSGETVGVLHDGVLVHETDLAVLVKVEGDELWVPKSLIYEADEEALIVAKWWCDQEGVDYQ